MHAALHFMEDTSHLSKQLVVKPVKKSLQNTVFWGRFLLIGVQPGFASPKGVLYMAMAAMLLLSQELAQGIPEGQDTGLSAFGSCSCRASF